MRLLKNLCFGVGITVAFSGPPLSHAQTPYGSIVAGTITQSWVDSRGVKQTRGYSVPLPVRPCSIDRVLQTQSDQFGVFRFLNVPPGIYELETAGQVRPPRTIKGIEIKAGDTQPIDFRLDLNNPQIARMEGADCFRDSRPPSVMDCDPTSFRIEYQPRGAQASPLISGQVTDWDNKKSKGLANAAISLTNVADPAIHYSAISNKHGGFQFDPPPGIYNLAASLQGFHDVQIAGILVPRENVTQIEVLTSNQRAIQVCE
jgi:hypothetical protein